MKNFLILSLACALSFFAQNAVANSNIDPLYRQARVLIQTGDAARAEEQLWRVLELDPNHVGAWLDLGFLYCDRGWKMPAEKIFTQVKTRYSPPQDVIALIDDALRFRCGDRQVTFDRRIRLSAGFDSNANLGIAHGQITLIDSLGPYSLTLAKESQPRESAWLEQEFVISQQNPSRQLWFVARALEFTQMRGYDRLQLETGVQFQKYAMDHVAFAQVGSRDGQTDQATLGWQTGLKLNDQFGVEFTAAGYHYPKVSITDHLQVEARLTSRAPFSRFGGTGEASFAVGAAVSQPFDAAAPGGMRQGVLARGALGWRQGPWELAGRLFWYDWADSEVYNPVIGAVERRQRLIQGDLRLLRNVSAKLLCGLTFSRSISQDRVDLFDYTSSRSGLFCESKF